jgi:hypothetical protein
MQLDNFVSAISHMGSSQQLSNGERCAPKGKGLPHHSIPIQNQKSAEPQSRPSLSVPRHDNLREETLCISAPPIF